jgi:hypothetical protein
MLSTLTDTTFASDTRSAVSMPACLHAFYGSRVLGAADSLAPRCER